MNQIAHGSESESCPDYLSVTLALQEAGAQLETLRVLGNAILQHREFLDQGPSHDYVAKIPLTIPMR